MSWMFNDYSLGRSRSPSPSGRRARKDSPTPATEIKGKKTTVPELTKGKQTINVSLFIAISITIYILLNLFSFFNLKRSIKF